MAQPFTVRSLIRIRQPKGNSMRSTLYSLLVCLLAATLTFGSVVAAAPKSKNPNVTLVYKHELPNCPGKSIKGVLVEYGPGGYSPAHTHAKSAFIYATVLEGAAVRSMKDRRRPTLPDRTSPNSRATVTSSAPMPARRDRPSCWLCSWWIRMRWN
jgi:hypothetical protein